MKITNDSYDKYITTSEFNKLTAEIFAARLALAKLVTKMINWRILIKKLTETKQNMCLLKMS